MCLGSVWPAQTCPLSLGQTKRHGHQIQHINQHQSDLIQSKTRLYFMVWFYQMNKLQQRSKDPFLNAYMRDKKINISTNFYTFDLRGIIGTLSPGGKTFFLTGTCSAYLLTVNTVQLPSYPYGGTEQTGEGQMDGRRS